MTLKAKIATVLITTICSGVGTYELLRSRGGNSLDAKDNHGADAEEFEPNERDEDDSSAEKTDSTPSQNPDVEKESGAKENAPAQEKGIDAREKPELKLYREYLTYKKIELFDENTDKEIIKNTLLHRLLPHYRSSFKLRENNMFDGSSEIKFKGENVRGADGKTIYILKKNQDQEVEKLRKECIIALNKERPTDKKYDPQFYKLKN